MSLETIILANTKALEDLNATFTKLVPALAGGAAAAPAANTAAEPAAKATRTRKAATETAPAGAAATAQTVAPASTAAASQPGAAIDLDTYGKAVTDFAKAHGREAAVAHLGKFGAGRASEVKDIDREVAYRDVKAQHKALDDAKAAAAANAQANDPDSLI